MILAFGHQSRTGKDTAARFAVEALREVGLNAGQLAFAGPLKQVCYFLYGHAGLLDGAYYDQVPEARNVEIPLLGKTPVDVWVDAGQKLREVHPDTWVNWSMDKADRFADEQGITVISDLRFTNEASAVKRRDGWCVRVVREGAPIHRSDQQIADNYPWDRVIENNGSLEDLRRKVRVVVADFVKEVLRAG